MRKVTLCQTDGSSHPERTWASSPKKLTATKGLRDNKTVGQSEGGALFGANFGAMATEYCSVVFECELIQNNNDPTSSSLRPIAPTMVLKQDFAVMKDKFVQLM